MEDVGDRRNLSKHEAGLKLNFAILQMRVNEKKRHRQWMLSCVKTFNKLNKTDRKRLHR